METFKLRPEDNTIQSMVNDLTENIFQARSMILNRWALIHRDKFATHFVVNPAPNSSGSDNYYLVPNTYKDRTDLSDVLPMCEAILISVDFRNDGKKQTFEVNSIERHTPDYVEPGF